MSVIGFKKNILKDAFRTASAEAFILRCYEQIITGIWGSMVLFFIESSVYWLIGRPEEAKYFCKSYFIIFVVYTIFFLLSSILIPEIRKIRLRRQLRFLTKDQILTTQQRERLKSIVTSNVLCKGFFTKYGFSQFVMVVISNTMFLDACYAFEFLVDFISTKERPLSLFLSAVTVFIILLVIAWFVDGKIAKMMKKASRYRSIIPNIKTNRHIEGKQLMVQVMQLITKDTLENRTGQVLIEDFLEDVCQLMYVSNESKINKT